MIRNRHHLFLISRLLISILASIIIGISSSADAQMVISPEQISAIESEISRAGGEITPDRIESFKETPEFINLSPEEIIKGKEILEKNDTIKNKAEEKDTLDEEEEENPIDQTEDTNGDDKPESLFSKYRAVREYQSISTELLPFGYELFSRSNGNKLLPRADKPVSPDHIIRPGDEVKIMFWGRINANYNITVDRDGNITIPQIGPLSVNGMKFSEMKVFLARQAKQIVGANINVTMGSLKSIQVFILGDTKKPGSYALDSFTTISGALLASGGPTDIGSIRKIQLKRNDKLISTLDFYDFLLKGDKSKDKVLHSGDVVFIPTTGPLVGIAGNIKRPAIYELKGKSNLLEVIEMAGGLIPSAYTQQIQVERIEVNEREIVLDINDKDLTRSKDIMIQDGDLIKVFPIVDLDVNALFLYGNVKRPGKYEYKPGMRIKDLIGSMQDLLKETYLEYALIKRQILPNLKDELIPFNLGKLLNDGDVSGNIALAPQDRIYVFSKWLFNDIPYVTIKGEIRKGGKLKLSKNYRVKDAIFEAGGLTKDASVGLGEIFRTDKKGQITQIYFEVGPAMNEDSSNNLLLHDRDHVVIHSLWETRYKQTVAIDGEVNNPGEYLMADNMCISDLVFAAGNILESAYLNEAEVTSFKIDKGSKMEMERKTVDLRLALENDPAHDLLLSPHDSIFIKRIPDWSEKRYVSLTGEFRFPGNYIIAKGETLASVINRAGGFSDRAYLRGAVFTRESIKKQQQRSINEMVDRLERDLFTKGSLQASVATTETEVEAKKIEQEQQEKFLESLKKIESTGRMSVRMAHPRLLKGSEYDIALEDKDTLNIPANNSVVNVTGAVMSHGSFIYSEKLNYKDYIEMSGGYSKHADKKNVYVLKVDGSAMKLSHGFTRWNDSRTRWELTSFSEDIKEIESGDTIIIPEKLAGVPWLRNTQSMTNILYQIAVTAGVAVVLF